MKNKAFPLIIVILSLVLCISCNNSSKSNKKIISVSILPQKYIVQQIAGGLFEYNVMVPPGASPEIYEPTPKQLELMNKSMVYFRIGHLEFEYYLKQHVAKNVLFVDLSEDIKLIKGNRHHHNDEEMQHFDFDPHIWSSPKNVATMAQNITKTLCLLQPADSSIFIANHKRFNVRIKELDSALTALTSNSKRKMFFLYHPALTYLARDYGLQQISLEHEGKNPSPSHLSKIIEIAKKENIKFILIQAQFDTENAKTIAKEINGTIITIDPLKEDWEQSIREITAALQKALNE